MPRIGPNLWKMPTMYYWYREYEDGTVEYEFDKTSGRPNLWGTAPDGLVSVGWVPMDYSLSEKISRYGEIGMPPSNALPVCLDVRGVRPEDIVIYRDCSVIRGMQTTCRGCGQTFYIVDPISECPVCGNAVGDVSPAEWEAVEYVVGIRDVIHLKILPDSTLIASRTPFV